MGVNFALAAFVYFFLPETKKVALEHMDTLFGGTDHVEKGATILDVDEPGQDVMGQGENHGKRADQITEVEHAERGEIREVK